MSITLEIQQSLVADGDLFASSFDDEAGKKWFVKKIVAHLSNSPDVEGASRVYLAKAKMLVNTRRDPPQAREYAGVSFVLHLVVQAMYGAMGVHPAVFLDQDNVALLNFVTERRVRTIVQMRDSVNSPMFNFPVGDVWNSSLRPSARQFWQGNAAPQSPLWPFVLSPQGKSDRKTAITSLFALPQNTSDQHRVECQTAATMVLLDSLLVAANPSALFASLDGDLDGYLAIDNPDTAMRRFPVGGPLTGPPIGGLRLLDNPAAAGNSGVEVVPPVRVQLNPDRPLNINLLSNDDGGVQTVTITEVHAPDDIAERDKIRTSAAPPSNTTVVLQQTLARNFDRGTRIVASEVPLFHALTDARRNTALFEQRFVAIDDLQPGDVVHVLGHPLVRSKIPMSAFGGERCVIVKPWKPLMQIDVTGHGIGTMTLLDLTSAMVRVGNRLLTVARHVLNNYLTPALTIFPAASGQIPTPDNSAEGKALEARIKETIALSLNLENPDLWTDPSFFTGSWEVHNFPSFTASALPDLDRQSGFQSYPRYWALTIQGTIQAFEQPMTLTENRFFVFGYWPSRINPATPNELAWPAEISKNYVALIWGTGGNLGAADERRMFGIPYFDDRAGQPVSMPLFAPGPDAAGAPEPTVLTYADLLPALFNLAKNNDEAWVLRPHVSDDIAYMNHLRAIGAFPSTL